MSDQSKKWKSRLLTEIAGQAWQDEPELLGAVGSACDLLDDVRSHDELVRELTVGQIEEVRNAMAGIRDGLLDVWVALDKVAPASTCLGTLCVQSDHLEEFDRPDKIVGEVPSRRAPGILERVDLRDLADHLFWARAANEGLIDSVGGMEWRNRWKGTGFASDAWVEEHGLVVRELRRGSPVHRGREVVSAVVARIKGGPEPTDLLDQLAVDGASSV